jgi:hypothetical protein
MSKDVPVIVCPQTSTCWDMGDVISTEHAFQPNVQLFVIQTCSLSKISGFTRISWQAFSIPCLILISHWLTLNMPVFRCPHNENLRGLMSGDRAGQLPLPPRPIQCSLKVWLRCCPTMRRKWCGAPSRMNHTCCLWWRGTCSKNTDKSFTKKRRYLQVLVC